MLTTRRASLVNPTDHYPYSELSTTDVESLHHLIVPVKSRHLFSLYSTGVRYGHGTSSPLAITHLDPCTAESFRSYTPYSTTDGTRRTGSGPSRTLGFGLQGPPSILTPGGHSGTLTISPRISTQSFLHTHIWGTSYTARHIRDNRRDNLPVPLYSDGA